MDGFNFKYILQSFYIYILLMMMCYNDFITGVSLGAIARNPVIFLAPFFILIEFQILSRYRKVIYSRIDVLILLFTTYSVIISLFYMAYFMYVKGTNSFQEVSYFVKFLSYLITIISLFLTYRHAKFIFNNFNQKSVYFGVFFVLLSQFLILCVELMSMPEAFSMIHFVDPPPYNRVRLWTSEASIAGFYVPIICAIALYYSKNIAKSRVSSLICFLFYIAYAFFSLSKGFYVSNALALILFLVIIFFFYRNKNRNNIILFLCIILLPIYLMIFFPNIVEKLSSSGEAVTFSTRFLDIISSLIGLLDYPFGSGFGVYQEVLHQSLLKNSDKLSLILGSNIDTSEIDSFSYSLNGLGSKNLFSFVSFTCGLFGVYLMCKVIVYFLSKKFNNLIQLYFFLLLIIGLSLYMSLSSNYLLAFYIAFVERNCLIDKEDYKILAKY